METRAEPADATLLLELSREVTSTLHMREVLDRSLGALHRLVVFGGGAIALLRDGNLVPAATDPPAPPQVMAVEIPVGEGISGTIAATGEAVYIPDILSDPRTSAGGFRAVSHGVRSYFGWPLILQGRTMGVVQIDSPEVNAFPPVTQARVLAFAPTIAAAVQNALLFDQERDAADRLRDAERLKAEFVHVVSHELRTPMAALLGFTETIVKRADQLDPDRTRELAGNALDAAHRLNDLLGRLLELSELEQGALELKTVPVSVERLVHRAIHGPRTHHIETEMEPGLPRVETDPNRMDQVLQTLVDNARKYSPPGTSITIQARRDDGSVSIAVEDRGRGIPPDRLSHIFEPFFQVEESLTRTVGGLGIGLYLARGICLLLGADIEAQSRPGRGSRFTVHIPVAPDGA